MTFIVIFCTMEDNGNQNRLVTNIFQDIFLYAPQKKKGHIDLEQHEGE